MTVGALVTDASMVDPSHVMTDTIQVQYSLLNIVLSVFFTWQQFLSSFRWTLETSASYVFC